jgi:hypothetical protein
MRERERESDECPHFLLARVFPDATLSPSDWTEREREKERGKDRDKRERKREREKEGGRERERKRERESEKEGDRERVTGALAPFSYLVCL